MRITIDTKEDSHEDIKKILHILSQILENKDSTTLPTADTTSMMSMFSDAAPSSEPSTEETSAPDFSALLNLGKSEPEEPKDKPTIEFF